jgi:hypothetical protein
MYCHGLFIYSSVSLIVVSSRVVTKFLHLSRCLSVMEPSLFGMHFSLPKRNHPVLFSLMR